MPVVTSVTVQKRNTSRCNVSIDGSYAFSLATLDVSAYGLKIGLELSPETVEELGGTAAQDTAYESALRLLDVRMRSRYELQQRLQRKEFELPVIDAVLDRLEHIGLVNDEDFAVRWVRDRMNLRPRSKQQLSQELAQKGIAREISAQVLSALDVTVQTKALEALIQKRRQRGYDDQRIMAYLGRQGYKYGEIKQAFEALNSDY